MKAVLIIDDEKDLCALLTVALDSKNYSVECAHTLAEAHLKLKNRPELVLLDNNLPDGSGLEYYHLHSRQFKHSCVIFITADSSSDIAERADLAGVNAFIRKPFSLTILKETIKKLI